MQLMPHLVCKAWAAALASPGPLYVHLTIDPALHTHWAYRGSNGQSSMHNWVRKRLGSATTSAEIANIKRTSIQSKFSIEPELYGVLMELGNRAPQLRRLVIEGCSGVISNATFAVLQHLTSLQHLHVESVYVPEFRDNLNAVFGAIAHGVRHIHVAFDHALPGLGSPRNEVGFPKSLLRCARLTTLELHAPACASGEVLSGLLRLGKLPEGISTLQRLEELTLVNACVNILPDELGALSRLRVLEVITAAPDRLQREEPSTPAARLEVPASLAALTALQRLAITCAQVPPAVTALVGLTELWLDQLGLGAGGGAAAIELTGLARLRKLRLLCRLLRLSNGGPLLCAALPGLAECRVTTLQLDGCRLTNAQLPAWADLRALLSRLHVLCLRRNLLHEPPPWLDRMIYLKVLDLSHNPGVSIMAASRKLLTPRHQLELFAVLQEPVKITHCVTKQPKEWTMSDVKEMLAMQREAAQSRPKDAPALHLAVDETHLRFPQLEVLLPFEHLLGEMPPRDAPS